MSARASPPTDPGSPRRRRATDIGSWPASAVQPLHLRPPSQRLGARLMRATLMASGLSLLLAGLILNLFIYHSQLRSLQQDMRVHAHMLAESVAGALVFGDHRAAQEALNALHAVPAIAGAHVRDAGGREFAHRHRAGNGQDDHTDEATASVMVVSEAVRLDGRELGQVQLEVSLQALQWRVAGFVLLTLAAAAAALAASYALARGVRRDIDRTEQHLDQLAYVDAVTALPNRRAATQQLQAMVQRHAAEGRRFGLLLLDLDDFSRINNSLGHAAGDAVLRGLSDRLAAALQPGQSAFRFGGDEFIVVFDDDEQRAGVPGAARLVQQALGGEVAYRGEVVRLRGSAGIARYPDDGSTADELVRAADLAMYEAKQKGKNMLAEYSAELASLTQARLRTETELRRALAGDELLLHYQPLVDMTSGRIVGVEALVRWQHPERGLLAPAEFIDVAERSGLVVDLGQRVLLMALRQIAAWQDEGLAGFTVAVNASARQLRDGLLLAQVQRALQQVPVDAARLEIEITEHSLVDHHDSAQQALDGLRRLGMRIAIDDFGTGLSSLARLRGLPVDKLKIDRSFVHELPGRGGGEAIVHAVVSMAHALGLRVVAEGVETREQLVLLRRLGVDIGQGFALGRPQPPAQMAARLRGRAEAVSLFGALDG